MTARATKGAVLTGAALFFLFACAAENTADVKDVRSACEKRLTWKNAQTPKCTECKASARLQECECPALTESSGKCADEGTAVFAEKSCTDAISKCVDACKDCDCVDACYDSAPNCKTKTGALDGCVATVCANSCQ